ncbi:MAG: hypothetical protein AB7G12_12795 [Thermoanaerobaculia bacterium]
MQLAREAGRLDDWRAYLGEIDPEEFELLFALYQVEPWGEARADRRTVWMIETLAALFGKEVRLGAAETDYLGLLQLEEEYVTFEEMQDALGVHS